MYFGYFTTKTKSAATTTIENIISSGTLKSIIAFGLVSIFIYHANAPKYPTAASGVSSNFITLYSSYKPINDIKNKATSSNCPPKYIVTKVNIKSKIPLISLVRNIVYPFLILPNLLSLLL